MSRIIDEHKADKTAAFAHSISADLHHTRNMTAGVAVTFRKKFKRPATSDCKNKFLAIQNSDVGATVYALITKDIYWSKPTRANYESAFKALEEDLREKKVSNLFCSPIGCVRDNVDIETFANNIVKLQESTKVSICIVTSEQWSARRRLRRGLSQSEFVKQLQQAIVKTWKSSTLVSHHLNADDAEVMSDSGQQVSATISQSSQMMPSMESFPPLPLICSKVPPTQTHEETELTSTQQTSMEMPPIISTVYPLSPGCVSDDECNEQSGVVRSVVVESVDQSDDSSQNFSQPGQLGVT